MKSKNKGFMFHGKYYEIKKRVARDSNELIKAINEEGEPVWFTEIYLNGMHVIRKAFDCELPVDDPTEDSG